ncbi:membrane protein [Streptomyces sulfonofaciens]|uniref:protein-serine/threonine phosphatase n=1 Tax=Streptomyces sulfonofaciens TaxID=68272 RepID=A0A919GH84_9ACTN|nr:SpoIIE family protein phosphatase [Streptomyces sulfonofaciens]GHH84728.1 membrane protein [Streptomyces sulfonofaciens]
MAHPSSGDAPERRESAPAPVFGVTATALVDGTGRITGWSQGMEQLLGHRAADVVGRSVDAVLADAQDRARGTVGGAGSPGEADAAWLRALVESGCVRKAGAEGHWSCVLRARHGEGRSVPVAIEATPMAGPGGGTQWLLSAVGLSVSEAAATDGSSLLRTLMERSPVALAVWDTDLNCIWVNATAAEVGGMPSRRVGRPLNEAAALGFDLSAIAPVMKRVLRDGKPVIDLEVRRSRSDGEESALSASVFRLDGADGTPQGLCTVGIDVSDSLARQRLALLNKAGTRVGTTLDTMATAQELADIAIPALADFATVDLADWFPIGEVPRERPGGAAHGDRPAFRRGGMASIHKGVPEAVFSPGEVVYQPASSPMVKPLLTGESYFEPRLDTAHHWLTEDPVRAEMIRRTGMHSVMYVPLKARGAILGVAVFARTENPVPFTRDDLLLAEELATRAALSLDNARRYSRERSAALALQRDLLPRRLSGGAGLEVASRYLPTDKHEGVGGDWYDVISLSRDRVALVVGDVVGHGINAAAAMGRLRTAVHTLAALDLPPDLLLAHLDQVALTLSDEAVDGDRFGIPSLAATCVYAVYDPATRVCTLARAGHPPPAIVTPQGRTSFPEVPTGGPVGWGLATYESVDVKLAEGSTVALFTDGLIESRKDDIDTGLARLATALRHDTDTLDACCAHVIRTMLRSATPEDDVSLLLARTRAPGAEPVRSRGRRRS